MLPTVPLVLNGFVTVIKTKYYLHAHIRYITDTVRKAYLCDWKKRKKLTKKERTYAFNVLQA